MKILKIYILLVVMLIWLQQTAYSQLYGPDKVKLFKPLNLITDIWSIEIDRYDVIWAGTKYNGLLKYEYNNWIQSWNNWYQYMGIMDLDVYQYNKIWFTNGTDAAFAYEYPYFYRYNVPDCTSCNIVNIITNGSKVYMAGLDSGIYKYDYGWTKYSRINDSTELKKVRSLVRDSYGYIWFTNFGKNNYDVVRFNGDNFVIISNPNYQSPNGSLNGLTIDKKDHIWYSTINNSVVEIWGLFFYSHIPPSNINTGYIHAMAVDNYDNKWIAAQNGLYKLKDNQWVEFKYSDLGLIIGQPGSNVFDIAVDNRNNLWMASNWGIIEFNENGINSGTTNVEENLKQIPESYSLYQNYPNPFNPSTTIKFDIKEAGLVTLKIYDLLGREVRTLLNEEKSAGSYKINFDASNLPSGIYFYKIATNDFVQTKKLLLLK